MHTFRTLLLLVAAAVAVGLVVAGLVYAGGSKRAKRYRPGRPFAFTPVWFLAAPEHQAISGTSTRRELMAAPGPIGAGRGETGGASDRW